MTEQTLIPVNETTVHPETLVPEALEQLQHKTPTDPSSSIFRLLDLPIELQTLIIHHALNGPYDITLSHERISMLRSINRMIGISSSTFPLLLTSHHISKLTSTLRHSLFTGRLILNSVFILVPLRRQARYEWIRTNTRILHFSDSSVHPERWGRYFDMFEALKMVEIEFPMVKKLGEAVKLEDVLGGREDERLIACLDRFMISLLGGSALEFWVTARFALNEGVGDWSGVVTCDITCDGEGVKIVKRRYLPSGANTDQVQDNARPIVHANGNVLDEGSHRSLWEWQNAMTT